MSPCDVYEAFRTSVGLRVRCRVLAVCSGNGGRPFSPFPWRSYFSLLPSPLHELTLVTFCLLSFWIADKAQSHWGRRDDPRIVIDEIVGFLLAMLWLPTTAGWIIAGFFLFRFFDILKPPPIRRLEKVRGGFGVVLDDVLAGLYAQHRAPAHPHRHALIYVARIPHHGSRTSREGGVGGPSPFDGGGCRVGVDVVEPRESDRRPFATARLDPLRCRVLYRRARSATGLTNVSGSSAYFEGGVVSYSNRAKAAHLPGSLEPTVQKHGAVGFSAVAKEDRRKEFGRRSGQTFGLSTTGVAGPAGGTKTTPRRTRFHRAFGWQTKPGQKR